MLTDEDLAARRDADFDGFDAPQFGGDDCNDADGSVFPGANDAWYDGTDADCAGNSDFDQDGDGFEATEHGGDDCDDLNVGFNPDIPETDCTDDTDYDCDGITPFIDGDDDLIPECTDCDDTNPAIGSSLAWYADLDGDGYGDTTNVDYACLATDSRIADGTDCDDTNSDIHPAASEYCGGVDNDCDGETNEDNSLNRTSFYADADADGFGAPDAPILACSAPPGFVCNADDCDDGEDSIFPGAVEWSCNGIDDACDGDNDPETVISVPTDFASIQDAIQAAGEGGTVCVAAGTYQESIEIYSSGITLEGVGSGESILDGEARRRPILISNRENISVRGFGVINGAGGSVRAENSANITLESLDISGNSSGSALAIYGTTNAVVRTVSVYGNLASGYLVEGGGVWFAQSSGSFERVQIVGNTVEYETSCVGAGMYVQASTLAVSNSIIAGNACIPSAPEAASASGAGIHLQGSSTLTLQNSVIFGNHVTMGSQTGGTVNIRVDGGGEALVAVNSVNANGTSDDITACGGWCGDVNAEWSLDYTDTWNNVGEEFPFADPTGTNGNISVDPLFMDTSSVDPSDWDFHLGPGSPLIDAGDPSILDPDCTPSDIGAYGGAMGRW